jgi:hypothetical protein
VQGLATILAADVSAYSDGGGKVSAATRPLLGVERVTAFVLGLLRQQSPSTRFTPVRVNGRLALAICDGDTLNTLLCAHVVGERIQTLYFLRNPDKLRHLRGCCGD